ncbi:MAG: PAS domain-containing protein [Chitinophagales bacterium]|nr:PAS domain-containing protein [Chitinophagaceae bacterium]MCB9065027.1 PAS domain-containing protein [Chitinophagales bacterium]
MFKLKYFWPYLLFAGTIIFLVTANRINIKNEIDRNIAYTRTLNVSGKQRMLSQKLAKLAYQGKEGVSVSEDMLNSIALWEKAHGDLKNSENGVHLYPESHPEVVAMFSDIEDVYSGLYNDYKTVAKSGATDEMLTSIDEQESIFLEKMDAIVHELEANAQEDLDASRERQMMLALISGIVLLLEMVIFVYPYHKRLIKAYKKVLRQQEELEENTRTITHLFETSDLIIQGTNAGIWEWDIKTGEENWSDRFYQILGYKRGDIEANYDTFLNKLLHPDDKEKVKLAVDEHLKNKTPCKYDIRMLNSNDEYVWYETCGQARWDEAGNAVRMAGCIIDITERMDTRNKLVRESSTKEQLLAIISHDLKSPINNLKGLLELLKENIINKEEFLEHLSSTAQNVDMLSTSLDNILSWAQTQRKGWEVKPIEFKVNDAVEECIRLYKSNLKDKNIALEYTPDELLKGYADFNQMVLVVRNVLNNAIKFTPEKGSIKIDIEDMDNYAAIVITDTGKGMDQETLSQVMNSESVYSTKGTNGEKGTGLGMNMCVEFSKKNNCEFKISSNENVGTVVRLEIPKAG